MFYTNLSLSSQKRRNLSTYQLNVFTKLKPPYLRDEYWGTSSMVVKLMIKVNLYLFDMIIIPYFPHFGNIFYIFFAKKIALFNEMNKAILPLKLITLNHYTSIFF